MIRVRTEDSGVVMSKWKRIEKLEGLVVCVGQGRLDVLEEALLEGYDFRRELYNGQSVVTIAAGHGTTTLRGIFELIKTVDVREPGGHTTLMDAVACNNVNQILALLELGASTELTCDTGENALHLAAVNPPSGEVARILAPFASLHALLAHNMDVCGETPITLATSVGSLEHAAAYCDRLIELRGPLDLRVGPQSAPICHYLERAGADDVVERLVAAGASPEFEPREE